MSPPFIVDLILVFQLLSPDTANGRGDDNGLSHTSYAHYTLVPSIESEANASLVPHPNTVIGWNDDTIKIK